MCRYRRELRACFLELTECWYRGEGVLLGNCQGEFWYRRECVCGLETDREPVGTGLR